MCQIFVFIGCLHDKEAIMAALPMGQEVFNVDQVAEHLMVNRRTVINLLKGGKLRGYQVGRQWRIDREDIEKYVEEQKQSASEGTTNA